jgi:hypothetical protein
VGSGGSQDAEYKLKAGVPAGAYHVICDAIIIRAVDVGFALVHRRGGADLVQLAAWTQHFEPLSGGDYSAQPYELDVDAPAIDFQGGDELVFRYTGISSTAAMAFIPNGDGRITNGRIPNLTLPR